MPRGGTPLFAVISLLTLEKLKESVAATRRRLTNFTRGIKIKVTYEENS